MKKNIKIMGILFRFDRKNFIEESQANYLAPQYYLLKSNLGAWLHMLLFVITFGWFWYPLVFVNSIKIGR